MSKRAVVVAVAWLALVGAGCDSSDRVQRCTQHAHCDSTPGSRCVQACSGQRYCAEPVDSQQCSSGFRWIDERASKAGEGLAGMCVLAEHTCEPDAGVDGGVVDAALGDARAVDGAVDAPVADASLPPADAAEGTHFDVVYASEMSIGPSTQFGVYVAELMIVNTGTTPLQMATVEIAVAGQPTEAPISFAFTEESHDGLVVVDPGEAYGDLDAAQLQTLVPEPVVGTGNLGKVIFADVPSPDPKPRPRTVSGAIGLITINGQTAVLPFALRLREGSSGSEPSAWSRVSTP